MKRMCLLLLLLSVVSTTVAARDCEKVLTEMRLPAQLKTRGKPARVHWEQADAVITKLRNGLQGKECEFAFGQIFKAKKKKIVYFPLTNNVVRTTPAEALKGLEVFNQRGQILGQYEGRVTYERGGGTYAKNGYTLYYFQMKDQRGELQSTGNRLLLDDYLVKWEDLKNRVAISTK